MDEQRRNLWVQLIAARARLLHQTTGVDEAALATPIFTESGWTPLHLLTHIAEQDWYYAQSIQHILEGQLNLLYSEAQQVVNANLMKRVNGRKPPEVADYVAEQQTRLMMLLAQVPDELYAKLQKGKWGEGSAAIWAQRRYLHDVVHGEHLREWRRQQPESPGSKSLLLLSLRAAHDDFLTSAALIPESERESRPVCGEWLLKDLIGHMADWDRIYLDRFKALSADQEIDTRKTSDFDRLNTEMVEARRNQKWSKVWKDFETVRAALLKKFTTVSDKKLRAPRQSDLFPTLYHLGWVVLEHYLEHAAILRRETGVKIPAWLLEFEG